MDTANIPDCFEDMVPESPSLIPRTLPVDDESKEPPLRVWQEALIDVWLDNPEMKQRELAVRFGKTEAWLSRIVTSDAFQKRLEERRNERRTFRDEALAQKTAEVANRGLSLLLDIMEKKRHGLEFTEVADVTNKALERLGFTQKKQEAAPQQPAVTINNVTALEFAQAQRLTRLHQEGKLIDASPAPTGTAVRPEDPLNFPVRAGDHADPSEDEKF